VGGGCLMAVGDREGVCKLEPAGALDGGVPLGAMDVAQGSSGARTSPFGQAITARGVRSMLAHAVRHRRRRRR